MDAVALSRDEGRLLLVKYQELTGHVNGDPKETALNYIKKVGCIQYDPLNVVGRNADLVLRLRVPGYSPALLDELLYTQRQLIDGWDKMMSIYHVSDWPYMHRVRDSRANRQKRILRRRNSEKALDHIDEIEDLIRVSGPQRSGKINLGSAAAGTWGHRSLSSAAMDYMFHAGSLGIYKKTNTQKSYDLLERLLPADIFTRADPFESEREFLKWYAKRRIGSVGLIWGKNGDGWLGEFIENKSLRDEAIAELLEEKSVSAVRISGIKDPFYIRTCDMDKFLNDKKVKKTARFLAPLDNLLWDRAMIRALFDFDYSWEVYIPQNKRRYGYYVLPVLYGDRFVARFEPEFFRAVEPFRIKNWWWEPKVNVTQDMKNEIIKEIERFCIYLGCDHMEQESLELIFKR